jgi:hypothetical protein
MPFGRYFRFAGSALLSFLYLVDWYMPRLAAEPAHSQVVRSTIRIHSEHQWPKAVAIDTNVKTINAHVRDFTPSPVDPRPSKDKFKNEAFAYAPAYAPGLLPQFSKSPKPKRATTRLAKQPMRDIRRRVVSEQTQSTSFYKAVRSVLQLH